MWVVRKLVRFDLREVDEEGEVKAAIFSLPLARVLVTTVVRGLTELVLRMGH